MFYFKRVISGFLIMTFLVFCSVSYTAASNTWSIQRFESGNYSSIALDSTDNPHISYYSSINSSLSYAAWDGSKWSVQNVDNIGDSGMYSRIALTTQDYPNICYYDATNQNLKYASWDGREWRVNIVESLICHGIDLCLDSRDNPHIVYFDFSNDCLKYATLESSQWKIQEMEGSGYEVGYPSIDLTTTNQPVISYTDSGILMLASGQGTKWVIEQVDSDHLVGTSTALSLDRDNNPVIIYGEPPFLKCASYKGGWHLDTISTNTNYWRPFAYNSIALDQNSDAKIVVAKQNGFEFIYYDGSEWRSDSVYLGSEKETWNISMALGQNGDVHMSFFDGSLCYAYRPK